MSCDLLQEENLAAHVDIRMVFINEMAHSDVRLPFEKVKTQFIENFHF
ncbi:hypothetical protein [Bacteroidetes bacterium endosymbiont of Geopemphigus sp.]|nr:hypothetical protein [Bacteroidetes bacterium endosymbiont of Geopemphigus sp.]